MTTDFWQEYRDQVEVDAAERRNGSSPTAWPEPLATAAFNGLPGDAVELIAPHSEADPVGLLAQFLVSFGSVVGRGPHYRVEGDEHHAAENVVLVGESSKARKGTSWGRNRQLFELVDPDWTREKTAGGLSTGEGLIWELRDPVTKRVKELDAKKKPTGQWVVDVEDPGVDDKRLLAQEAELSRYFAVMSRDGNTLSETLRKLWDSGTAAARAKTSRARCTSAHFSIVGHIPIDEVRRGLTRTEAANGFANRFLWFAVRRARVLPFGGELPEDKLHELAADVADAVRAARTLGRLEWSAGAREVWAERYEQLSAGKPGMLGAIVARGEAHVVRLALIYALCDASREIRVEHLSAALAVWEYAERSAQYVFGDAVGDPIADDVLRELRDRPGGMTRSEIRELLGGSYNADRIQAALDVLRRHRLAWMVKETGGQGRPAERWHATTADAKGTADARVR